MKALINFFSTETVFLSDLQDLKLFQSLTGNKSLQNAMRSQQRGRSRSGHLSLLKVDQ